LPNRLVERISAAEVVLADETSIRMQGTPKEIESCPETFEVKVEAFRKPYSGGFKIDPSR